MKKIFIPDRFLSLLPKVNKPLNPAFVRVDGYVLSGYQVELSERSKLMKFLASNSISKKIGFLVEEGADIDLTDSYTVFFFSEEEHDLTTLVPSDTDLGNPGQKNTVDSIVSVLRQFQEVSGKSICLHVHNKGVEHYPIGNEYDIHIVLGGIAPGENESFSATYIDDVKLDSSGYDVSVPGSSKGYGYVVTDDNDRRIAQIVGSTIYFFVPVSQKYLHLLAGKRVDIFRIVLTCAWKAMVLNEFDFSRNIISSENEFIEYQNTMYSNLEKGKSDHLEKIDKDIENCSRNLRDLILSRKLLIGDATRDFAKISKEDSISSWEKLSNHQFIDFLEIPEDDCLHVHTKFILVPDDDGCIRNLGKFIIRIAGFGDVFIWSKCIIHPEGVPHPHISKCGSVCFGNVSLEINRLAAEYKHPELITLIMSWLVEGYEANLADAKLGEWPLADEINTVQILDLDLAFSPMKIKESKNE